MKIAKFEKAVAIEVADATSLVQAVEFAKANVTIDDRMAYVGHVISGDGIVLFYAERFEVEEPGLRRSRKNYSLSDLPLFKGILRSEKREVMWT
jgi:hypothetical protein